MNRLEIYLNGQLNDARIASLIILAEESPERAIRACDRARSQVIGYDRLAEIVKYRIASGEITEQTEKTE